MTFAKTFELLEPCYFGDLVIHVSGIFLPTSIAITFHHFLKNMYTKNIFGPSKLQI